MKYFGRLHICGTSHIAGESVRQAKEGIANLRPEIVALELDPGRAHALKNREKRRKGLSLIRDIGLSGYFFLLFGEFVQKNLGKALDIEPGSEMLAAMDAAKEAGSSIYLIDRDIRVTLQRFSKHFRKREFFKMFFDLAFSPIKGKKKTIDLSKVPSEQLISEVIKETKKRYPSLYKILIDERDRHMAARLFWLMKEFPEKNIFAVMGAGHVAGVINYLEKMQAKNTPDMQFQKKRG